MEFSATLFGLDFDIDGYKAALHEHMSRVIAEAATQWLGAVVQRIPVWSGASRATFVPLASLVGFEVNIDPVARTRFGLGLENAEGNVEADGGKGLYEFTYSTTLPHLIWNEFHNANIDPDPTKFPPPAELHNPGPYEFQKLGLQAFDQFASDVTLPDPSDFIKATPRTV